MAQIPIIGSEGKPILYAYLDEADLKFEFEYYGTGENGMDYEFIHTVKRADQAAIVVMFGLDPKSEILAIIQQLSDGGHGEELKEALTDKVIPNELWTWMS